MFFPICCLLHNYVGFSLVLKVIKERKKEVKIWSFGVAECSLCSAGETEAAEQARIGGKGAFGVTYNITLAI